MNNKYEVIEMYGKYVVKFTCNHVTIEVFNTLDDAQKCILKLKNGIWFK